MAALFIALWVLIFAPLALTSCFLTGDTGGLTGPARQPASSPDDQPREVARLAHAPRLHTRDRAA